MKTILKLATLFLPIILIHSCVNLEDSSNDSATMVELTASAGFDESTKTSMNRNMLSWNEGDEIGLFVSNGLQKNVSLRNIGSNDFSGGIVKTGLRKDEVSYYAYYPYTYNPDAEANTISAELPSVQGAPFSPDADFMVSDPIAAVYDEENMPELNFVFRTHLFSILKLTILNTNEALKDERLMGIDITSGNSPLAGKFTFDVSNPAATLSFTETTNSISVNFSETEIECPILGYNVAHTIYAVVNNIDDDNISVRIRTNRRSGYVYSSRKITTHPGEITILATVDFNALRDVKILKRLVYWGDSCASSNIIVWLQKLLGDEWKVIGGGIRGATALSVAARQGALPLCFSKSVTIPGDHNSSVKISKFNVICTDDTFAPQGTYNVSSQFWVDVTADPYCNPACPNVNDFEVCGVRCRMTEYNSGIYVSRVEDGDPVVVPENTPIITYAAREYRDVDVNVTYMGINQRGTISDIQLANCFKAMTDFSYSKKFIAVGFHFDIINGRDYRYWTPEYRDYFRSEFGDNYLDLRTVGSANAERLCVETGQHSSASEMSQEDKLHVSMGEWPVSWTGSYQGDIHPTVWGHRAIAIMVYEKMQELGYLDL